MFFELLQQDVDVESGVTIIEPNDEAERHEIRLQRVDEASTERVGGQRPAERMDHAIERSFCLPELFDSEREDLGILGRHALPLTPRLRQQSACSLRECRDFGDNVVRRHRPGRRAAIAIEAGCRGPHARHRLITHQQLRRRKSREEVDPEFFGLRAQPANDLTQRGHVVPAIVHGGRRGKTNLAAFRQHVDSFFRHGCSKWKIRILEIGEQLAQRAGIDDRTGERMLAQRLGLLQHADVQFTAVGFRELRQRDRACQPGGTRADDDDVELHPIAGAFGAVLDNELLQRQRRLILRRNEPLPSPFCPIHGASESLR